ncbi:ABC transporter substrate-binding protein [Mycolicibacillus trivialis]
MSRSFRTAAAVTGCLAVLATACGTPAGEDSTASSTTTPTTTATKSTDGDCITDFDPHTDYFPTKSTVVDATNFTLRYHKSYQVLTVNQPYPGGAPQSYVLVHCGAPDPELTGDLADAPRIEVPVDSVYSGSTTQLGMFAELDKTGLVTGVAGADNVVNDKIRGRINDGDVLDFAPGGQINTEMVATERPDVLLTDGLDNPGYAKIADAGTAVVADAEWLENTPLGRAEWVKVIAALTGAEEKAAETYGRLRNDYEVLVDKAAAAPPVQVLPGTMDQGTWSMPTGREYTGRLIVDAGGAYRWAEDPGTNLKLSFEAVYAEAGQAPVWLVNTDWETLADALAADNRYGELAAVRDGAVWSADKAIGPAGGNDYWERGVARPDLVLADLIAILHPDLQPDHRFEFYRQVPRG